MFNCNGVTSVLQLAVSSPYTCIQSNGVVTVMCTNEYINPLGLTTDEDRNDQEGDPTVSMGNGRRRKRSTVKRTLRKRQDAPSSDETVSQNITLVSVHSYCMTV